MTVRCGIALCIMLAIAVGRIKEKQMNKMRGLVKPANFEATDKCLKKLRNALDEK